MANLLTAAAKAPLKLCLLATLISLGVAAAASTTLFQDRFEGKLGEGWSWLSEHPGAWRVTPNGLEVPVEPGNMWGAQNDARNLLVRPAPEQREGACEFGATIENRPSRQYEQVDLVYYLDDGNMVKLGQELVDGKLSIVMGREEQDRARTVNRVAVDAGKVRLRLFVRGRHIRGQFQVPGAVTWQDVGECDLPQPPNAKPRLSLQFYQGPAEAEHWARVTGFYVKDLSDIYQSL
jgi:regulation of enolase protein 1 (concanavalin A-like superfamily)